MKLSIGQELLQIHASKTRFFFGSEFCPILKHVLYSPSDTYMWCLQQIHTIQIVYQWSWERGYCTNKACSWALLSWACRLYSDSIKVWFSSPLPRDFHGISLIVKHCKQPGGSMGSHSRRGRVEAVIQVCNPSLLSEESSAQSHPVTPTPALETCACSPSISTPIISVDPHKPMLKWVARLLRSHLAEVKWLCWGHAFGPMAWNRWDATTTHMHVHTCAHIHTIWICNIPS